MSVATKRYRIETYTGKFIDYHDPRPEDIDIVDIAQALSLVTRYMGHIPSFYSVAEHCVHVSNMLRSSSSAGLARAGLLHDAHEAYVGDLATPLKNAIGSEYRTMVDGLDTAIGAALHVDPADFHVEQVRRADATMLRLEAHVFKPSRGTHPEWDSAWREFSLHEVPTAFGQPVKCWSPEMAKHAFLSAYEHLTPLP